MCMMATFRNRHPANVVPIDRSRGRFLKLLLRIGRVPKIDTIMKNIAIITTFRIVRISLSYIR